MTRERPNIEETARRFESPNWPRIPADPDDDSADKIGWPDVVGLIQIAAVVVAFVATMLWAAGLVTL